MPILIMTLSEIKTIVCKAFEIEEPDFVIFKKHFSHSHARYAYFVLCRKYTLETQKTIGETCCMDYTCVQRGIIRHPFLMANKREYALAFKKAEKELKDKTKLVFRDEGNSVLNTHQETERMVVASIQDV